MALRLYYSDHYPIPLPAGHRFPAGKYALLRGLIEPDPAFDLVAAPLAEPSVLALAHSPEYVSAVLEGTVDPAIMRRIGFPWSMELVRRTLASVGGTLAATAHAAATGFGGNLAGGTHHAFRDRGAGFCVFNDIAVAVRRHGVRAAVIDLDVHQGDGTAAIFAQDHGVFTLSIHGANNFPFQKQQSALDIALPDSTGDDAYLSALNGALPAVAEFRPKMVFYQSGVDALEKDRLGRLRLTQRGLEARDEAVFNFCRVRGIPVVVTLGGGYADPIRHTAEAHANTFRTAARVLGGSATAGRITASL